MGFWIGVGIGIGIGWVVFKRPQWVEKRWQEIKAKLHL